MSSLGIPQITAIMGMCVAGGAYLPVMTDTVLMTEGSGLFLAGPSLVQAAIGQKTDPEELGGASMHAEISGTVDFKEPDDHHCIARLRS
jgi:3-methylcrotonyl-CoA carboxylase beta subunit